MVCGVSSELSPCGELLEERGIFLDHATVNRWVIKFSISLEQIFHHHKKPVLRSWRRDETYIKVKGQWFYYYRALDAQGTVDFYLCDRRDEAAAKSFFEKAILRQGQPEKVNIDNSGANMAALQGLNKDLPKGQKITIRQVKYLNQVIEQDHRFIKKITKPMMGFRSFLAAQATLRGIELWHMIKKLQNKLYVSLRPWEQFYALVG